MDGGRGLLVTVRVLDADVASDIVLGTVEGLDDVACLVIGRLVQPTEHVVIQAGMLARTCTVSGGDRQGRETVRPVRLRAPQVLDVLAADPVEVSHGPPSGCLVLRGTEMVGVVIGGSGIRGEIVAAAPVVADPPSRPAPSQ
jgi:hypothetical protein